MFQTVEPVLTDKKDRALFLSNLITSDEQKDKPLRLWRVNLDALLANPKLMSEYPDTFSAACECKDLTRCAPFLEANPKLANTYA